MLVYWYQYSCYASVDCVKCLISCVPESRSKFEFWKRIIERDRVNLDVFCWQPCVLNCGHLFCKKCIDEWKKKKKLCPMCRAKISSCVRMHKMDTIIDKNVSLLSDEAKARRNCTIHERINGKFSDTKTIEPICSHKIEWCENKSQLLRFGRRPPTVSSQLIELLYKIFGHQK